MTTDTHLVAPFVVPESGWREVCLRVWFDRVTHEPLIIRVDTDDLTIAEEQALTSQLRIQK